MTKQEFAMLMLKIAVWIVAFWVVAMVILVTVDKAIQAYHHDMSLAKDPQAFVQSCQASTVQSYARYLNEGQELVIRCVGK